MPGCAARVDLDQPAVGVEVVDIGVVEPVAALAEVAEADRLPGRERDGDAARAVAAAAQQMGARAPVVEVADDGDGPVVCLFSNT